jgi:hypothetical protein
MRFWRESGNFAGSTETGPFQVDGAEAARLLRRRAAREQFRVGRA